MASSEFDRLLQHLYDQFKIRPNELLQLSDEDICQRFTDLEGVQIGPELARELKLHIQSPEFKDRIDYYVTLKFKEPEVESLPIFQAGSREQVPQEAELPARLAASSQYCALRTAEFLSQYSSNLDICFCIDGTGSMLSHIVKVKDNIIHVSTELARRTGMLARFALVVYRDYGDGDLRKEVHKFSKCDEFQTALGKVQATGGGDEPEDCFGGLMAAATELEWAAPERVLIWMGDSPQHGPAYNAGLVDNHPNEPDTPTSTQIFQAMSKHHIILVFCKITDLTDSMVAKLKEESKPFGANRFIEYSLHGDVGDFLVNVLRSTVSLTKTNGTDKPGPLKNYQLTPATWEINSLWGPEEEGVIFRSLPYEYGKKHPLLDLMMTDQHTQHFEIKGRFTVQPVEQGEMRIAYLAQINQSDPAPLELFGVAKESRYEGDHNSSANLANQARIQAVSSFLAAEFTIKLRKIHPSYEGCGVEYIPLEVIRLPNRPSGRHYLTYETFLPGKYLKFNGNNGFVDRILEIENWLPQTFSHFTYCYSRGLLLVSDLQGIISTSENERIHRLTDPAVHTADSRYLKDPTNLGEVGIQAFFSSHVCNRICQEMNLCQPNEVNEDDTLDYTDVSEAIQKMKDFTPTFHP